MMPASLNTMFCMGKDYDRLMEAARIICKRETAADVARLLKVENGDQTMTNWKARGIPSKELLNIAQTIGCDPFWLRDGEGDMVRIVLSKDDKTAIEINRSLRAGQRQAWYHVGNTIAEPGKGTNGKQ